jgi:23S rRNA pseudouridine2605 synthase
VPPEFAQQERARGERGERGRGGARRPGGASRARGPGPGPGSERTPGAGRGAAARPFNARGRAQPLEASNAEFPREFAGEFGGEFPHETADPAQASAGSEHDSAGSQKLQKVLADAGIGSRRAMEQLIARGAVTVNGVPASIGTRVQTGGPGHAGDMIAIDGRPVRARGRAQREQPKVLLYHKPDGEIVSRDDPGGRTSVFDALPRLRQGKWLAIGRLDYNTSGLLIFTDSGEFANALMHPSFGLEREYAVRVMGVITPEQAQQLTQGITLADGVARFDAIGDGGGEGANRWYRVIVTEGRNRLVRRMFEACRLTVSRLMRVRFGPIELPSRLKRGQYLPLSKDEVAAIQTYLQRNAEAMSGATLSAQPVVIAADGGERRPARSAATGAGAAGRGRPGRPGSAAGRSGEARGAESSAAVGRGRSGRAGGERAGDARGAGGRADAAAGRGGKRAGAGRDAGGRGRAGRDNQAGRSAPQPAPTVLRPVSPRGPARRRTTPARSSRPR